MALAKQATARSSAGFGRRGTISSGHTSPRPAQQRRPTISSRPNERTREALAEAAHAVAADVNTSASRGKAYVKACLAGTAAFIGGFAFWRAQGHPGSSSGAAAALDVVYEKVT